MPHLNGACQRLQRLRQRLQAVPISPHAVAAAITTSCAPLLPQARWRAHDLHEARACVCVCDRTTPMCVFAHAETLLPKRQAI